jgi:hypothetical protein
MPGKVGGGGHGHGNGNTYGVGKGEGNGNAVNSNGKGKGVEEKRAEEAARRAAEEAARKAAEEAARKAAEEAARKAAEEAARRAAEEAARRAQEATRRAAEAHRNAQEAQARARQASERAQDASSAKQEAAQQAAHEAAELQAKAASELEKAQQAQQEAADTASKLSKADADKLRDLYDGNADAVRKQHEKILGDQAAVAKREAKLAQEERQPHEEAYVVDADKAFVNALRKEQAELLKADSMDVEHSAPEADGKDGSHTNIQEEAQAELARSSAKVRSDEARSILAKRLADAERRRLSGGDNPI